MTKKLEPELPTPREKVSPGRIVCYRLTAYDIQKINHRRKKSNGLFEGLDMAIGEQLPMDVVRVSATFISGQVKLNGNDVLWVNAVEEGIGDGQWSWPPGRA